MDYMNSQERAECAKRFALARARGHCWSEVLNIGDKLIKGRLTQEQYDTELAVICEYGTKRGLSLTDLQRICNNACDMVIREVQYNKTVNSPEEPTIR